MRPCTSTSSRFLARSCPVNAQATGRNFASSTCSSNAEAESSRAAMSRSVADTSASVTRADREEAFQRRLRQIQAFRRQKEATHIKIPFIPQDEASQPIDTSPTPLRAALSTLMASGAALGGSPKNLNKNYKNYIYGYRSGLAIIDLEKTLPLLRHASAVIRDVVKADGVILFVGTATGMERCMDKAKKRMGDNGFMTNKWIPGLLTNPQSLFGLQPLLKGSNAPDLVVFLNPADVSFGVRECTVRAIPTIAIIDTHLDPRVVTYPIPANGDSLRTVELICGTLSMAGAEGRRMRLREQEALSSRAQKRAAAQDEVREEEEHEEEA
ncbi:ribosomal protein S2, flavodoxin-like domain-containing protein [Kockovaella imperatae]|uniref:Ribosomal protein S2, flavodoxin-like domain-containing protein n=1 Tax=Kockovaella imperatae TaxID=4999 RepID=A0A1Y1UGM5_9TREE|nr:ribosomal protein S2, flavodoxin-like domain-containing protein [Kockovaella imperatae]ORX37178.1 ribosomal protein S2, flavodoxin-like domain-containing protein [Kockovaella imperatae]